MRGVRRSAPDPQKSLQPGVCGEGVEILTLPDPGEGDKETIGEEEAFAVREKVQEKVRWRFNPATPLSCFESEKQWELYVDAWINVQDLCPFLDCTPKYQARMTEEERCEKPRFPVGKMEKKG